MPETRDAVLHLPGQGNVEASLLSAFLEAINQTHAGYIAFGRLTDETAFRGYGYRDFLYRRPFWDVAPPDSDRLVGATESLIVARVELTSPGSWDLLGVGKVLEQIRLYLDDRHRRKQSDALEDGELRRQGLENGILETELIKRQIAIAREAGLPEEDVRLIARGWIERPIQRLGDLQDRGVIDGSKAELRPSSLPAGE